MKKIMVLMLMFCLISCNVFAAPVPDTGVTKCYGDTKEIACPSPGQPFYGQDANYTINPISYTKLDATGNALPDSATSWTMVKDNVTGLIWEMKTNKDGVPNYNDPHDADNTYTWYDSNPATNGGYSGTPGAGSDTEDFIKALNDAKYGGYSNWRLPTTKELYYIVDLSIAQPGPTINERYFPNSVSAYYWSSATMVYYMFISNNRYAWGLNFKSGYDVNSAKSSCNYVRAVCGGQTIASGNYDSGAYYAEDEAYPNNEFAVIDGYTDNGDGTVTDKTTGLMWQQDSSISLNWEDALSYSESLSIGGYTDWRMPNIKELRSLVDNSRYNPAINITYFPGADSEFYWSSTSSVYLYRNAWGVDFSNGVCSTVISSPFSSNKTEKAPIRAVRGGQSGSLVISPLSRNVPKDVGTTTFSVFSSGAGTMLWTAAVTSGSGWLTIKSGASGTNAGTITCTYPANTGTASRTGTIRVTASGATGSPKDVTVTQAGTACAEVSSLWPVNNAHSGSTTPLWAYVKNTGSSALPSNVLVWYYVTGPNWTNYWVGSAPVSGQLSGSTKWYSYNWPIPATATPGTYTYLARVYEGNIVLSDWSAPLSFTIGINQKAVMTSPVNGSQLASTTQTFTWTSVSGATQYWLYLGSTTGGYNLYNQGTGTSTSRTITGLPSNGSMIYARLWTQYGGVWLYNDYSYKSH